MPYSGQAKKLFCIEVQQFNGEWVAEYLSVSNKPEQAVSYRNHSGGPKTVKYQVAKSRSIPKDGSDLSLHAPSLIGVLILCNIHC